MVISVVIDTPMRRSITAVSTARPFGTGRVKRAGYCWVER